MGRRVSGIGVQERSRKERVRDMYSGHGLGKEVWGKVFGILGFGEECSECGVRAEGLGDIGSGRWKVCGTRCPGWVRELGIRDRVRFGLERVCSRWGARE